LKRVLIHTGGFNLGLIMRQAIGVGTPRGLQGRVAAVIAMLLAFLSGVRRRFGLIGASRPFLTITRGWATTPTTLVVNSSAAATCTTGC